MGWERFGKDEPMGRVLLPVDLAVSRSYEDSFWLDLDDCKSGQILVSTQLNGLEESFTQSHITKESHTKSIPFRAEENESRDNKEYVTLEHEESEDKKENCDTEVKEIIEEFLNEGTSELEITENTAIKSNAEKDSLVTATSLTIKEKVSDDKGGAKELKKLLQESQIDNLSLESSHVEELRLESDKETHRRSDSYKSVPIVPSQESGQTSSGISLVQDGDQLPSPSVSNTRGNTDGNKQLTSKKEKSSAQQIPMKYIGKLKLIVKQAKDLEKKDVLQKADPYVIINYGSQTSKSKKVKNTLTPVWNHEVIFDLAKTGPRDIEIKLMDWERFGKDEPMGRVLLPVDLAVSRSYQDSFWLDLDDCKSGQILVSTQFNGLEESFTQSHI